jgi:hypothetical protein
MRDRDFLPKPLQEIEEEKEEQEHKRRIPLASEPYKHGFSEKKYDMGIDYNEAVKGR